MPQRPSITVKATLALLVVASLAVACGGSPEEAFCDELAEVEADARERARELEELAESDPLGGLSQAFAAMGDIGVMMQRLANKAPDEIDEDMQAIATAFGSANDPSAVAANPFGALLGGLAGGLMVQGSVDRVDAYALETCGQPVFGPLMGGAPAP